MERAEKLSALRRQMEEHQIDACLVVDADPHISEYAPRHYRERSWLSGFTGSNGTLVVTRRESGLWTDGRYYLQAERQLEGSEILLYRMSDPGVPRVEEFLSQRLEEGSRVALNGKLFSAAQVERLAGQLAPRQVTVRADLDLIAPIWTEGRDPISKAPAFLYGEEYAGSPAAQKLACLREQMEPLGLTHYLVSGLDDVNWLFNIRGEDVDCSPLAFSFGLVSTGEAILYLDEEKRTPGLCRYLKENGVLLRPYRQLYRDVAELGEGAVLGLHSGSANAAIDALVPQTVRKEHTPNLVGREKAVKNAAEMEWARRRHLQDGAVMVRFLCWLKNTVGRDPLTEQSAVEKLYELRAQVEGFHSVSFETIAGYQSNGAIVHYKPNPETAAPLAPEGLLLVDSGAQYLGSTTDITRTVALGPLTDQQKRDFTLVLKCFIRLSRARFLKGATGKQLDILSRGILWERGLDYKHGTGHGVGSFLGVHESPPNFSDNTTELQAGMIISVEPGLYREGAYGIRTENLVLVTPDGEDPALGQFLRLEPLTHCPIDLEAVELSLLTGEERDWLNRYHRTVRERLWELLPAQERDWLREATREI